MINWYNVVRLDTFAYEKTLGELDDEVKKSISHRAKVLELAKPIIEML